MAHYDDLMAVLKRVPDIPMKEALGLLTHEHKQSKYRCIEDLETQGRIVRVLRGGRTYVREAHLTLNPPRSGKDVTDKMPIKIDQAMKLLRFTVLMAKQHYDHPTRMQMMMAIREVTTYLEPFIEAFELLHLLSHQGISKVQYEQLYEDMEKNGWMKPDYETFDAFGNILPILFGQSTHPPQYAGLSQEWWQELRKMGTDNG